MPADFSGLQAEVAALTAQLEQTRGVAASAALLINTFAERVSTAVTQALTADNAADQGSIDAALEAIRQTKEGFAQSASELGAAVAANQ